MYEAVLPVPTGFLPHRSVGFIRVTGADIPALPVVAEEMAKRIAAIAQTADRQAFADVFRYFAPRVKSYLMRLGSEGALAEELMQEVMVTVWRKADQFDPSKASASTWVFAIARNLRIDVFRRERRPEFDPDDPALFPEADTPADAAMISDESTRRLHEALTTLPEAEQGILRMAYFDDKSQARIAQELRIPLGTVKSRVRLAFARLRAALEDESEGTP